MRLALVPLSVLGSALLALSAVSAAGAEHETYVCYVDEKGQSCPLHTIEHVSPYVVEYVVGSCALKSDPNALYYPRGIHCSSPNVYMDCASAPNYDQPTGKACKCNNTSSKTAEMKMKVEC